MYCCIGHWVVVCFDQQNFPDQKTSLLLLEWEEIALPHAQLIDR